jgi:hypothetical protein
MVKRDEEWKKQREEDCRQWFKLAQKMSYPEWLRAVPATTPSYDRDMLLRRPSSEESLRRKISEVLKTIPKEELRTPWELFKRKLVWKKDMSGKEYVVDRGYQETYKPEPPKHKPWDWLIPLEKPSPKKAEMPIREPRTIRRQHQREAVKLARKNPNRAPQQKQSDQEEQQKMHQQIVGKDISRSNGWTYDLDPQGRRRGILTDRPPDKRPPDKGRSGGTRSGERVPRHQRTSHSRRALA